MYHRAKIVFIVLLFILFIYKYSFAHHNSDSDDKSKLNAFLTESLKKDIVGYSDIMITTTAHLNGKNKAALSFVMTNDKYFNLKIDYENNICSFIGAGGYITEICPLSLSVYAHDSNLINKYYLRKLQFAFPNSDKYRWMLGDLLLNKYLRRIDYSANFKRTRSRFREKTITYTKALWTLYYNNIILDDSYITLGYYNTREVEQVYIKIPKHISKDNASIAKAEAESLALSEAAKVLQTAPSKLKVTSYEYVYKRPSLIHSGNTVSPQTDDDSENSECRIMHKFIFYVVSSPDAANNSNTPAFYRADIMIFIDAATGQAYHELP